MDSSVAELKSEITANSTAALGLNNDNLVQVFLALLLVIVVIFTLSLMLKKFNMFPGSSNGLIKVLAGISLGSKDRLLLIQVGEEQILISSSPGAVSKIHKMSRKVEVGLGEAEKTQGKGSFADVLKAMVSGSKQ